MKNILLLVVLLTMPMLTLAQDETSRRAAGCGPNEVQFEVKVDKKQHPRGALEEGKALVYVFDNRDVHLCVGCVPARVGVDGTWVGANLKASYFFFPVAPGTHNLCSSVKGQIAGTTNESLMASTFTAEPGQIYYFVLRRDEDSRRKFHRLQAAEGELEIGKPH